MKKSVLTGTVLFALLFSVTTSSLQAQQGSLNFPGMGQYVFFNNSNPLTPLTGDFTVDVWFYWRGGSPWQRLIGFGGSDRYFSIIPNAHPLSGGGVWFSMSNTVEGEQELLSTNTPINTNTWYHLAITLTHATNTGSMYLNGQLVATNTNMVLRPANLTALGNFRFGRSNFFGDPEFNGYIDAIRFSNSVRYTGNFSTQLPPLTADANTTGLWGFNEGAGEVLGDISSNGFNAIVGSEPTPDDQDPVWSVFNVLPIKFVSFSAQQAGAGTKLKWSTSIIDNDAGFTVEKSNNGVTYESLTTIRVMQHQQKTSFEYTDNAKSAGTVYYRIKLVELNKTSYSKILVRRFGVTGFSIQRTLVSNLLTVTTDDAGHFYIADATGRVVRRVYLSGTSGIDISGLSSGLYFINNGNGITLRFLKQ